MINSHECSLFSRLTERQKKGRAILKVLYHQFCFKSDSDISPPQNVSIYCIALDDTLVNLHLDKNKQYLRGVTN